MKNLLICLLLSVLLSSCCTTKPPLPDYSHVKIPNILDSVGHVFGIDDDGKTYAVDYLNIPYDTSVATYPEYKNKTETSLSALINFMGVPAFNLPFISGMKYKKVHETTIFIKDAILTRTNLGRIDLEKLVKSIYIDTKFIREYLDVEIYFIVEAIKAKEMKFNLNNEIALDVGISAELDTIASTNDDLKWDNKEEYQLEFSLDKALIVLIKTIHVTLDSYSNLVIKDKPFLFTFENIQQSLSKYKSQKLILGNQNQKEIDDFPVLYATGRIQEDTSVTILEPIGGMQTLLIKNPNGIYTFECRGISTNLSNDNHKLLLWIKPVNPPSESSGWYLQRYPNGIHNIYDDGSWEGKGQLGNIDWPPHEGDIFDCAVSVVHIETADELINSPQITWESPVGIRIDRSNNVIVMLE
ncbi:MAG: hypothetical protein ISS16_03320 [Ignavibacteria bacterium]|nr:hypothetical protein [Ignavibacteria bacterium]